MGNHWIILSRGLTLSDQFQKEQLDCEKIGCREGHGRIKKTNQEAFHIIHVKDNDGFHEDGSNGGDETWSDAGCR